MSEEGKTDWLTDERLQPGLSSAGAAGRGWRSTLRTALFLFGILVVVGAPVAVVVLGVLLVEARRRIRVLTDRIHILETRLEAGAPSPPATGAAPVVRMSKRTPAATPRATATTSPASRRLADAPSGMMTTPGPVVAGEAATSFPEAGAAPEFDGASDSAGSAWTDALRSLLFGGDTLVRIGVLLLFFGFSYFLSYAVLTRRWA